MSKTDGSLSAEEKIHYGRHLALEEVGTEGQLCLKNSSVLIIGLGGLGSPLALYLTAAGVGRIGIVEFDRVEASNLHRQVLYGVSQVGKDKLKMGLERLRELNPHVKIETHPGRITRDNARQLIRDYDIVADGADNFQTRYLVNDACVLEKKPLVSASILGFEGQLAIFGLKGGPCYRCLYPEPPPAGSVPSCAEGGVLGVLPGVMGSLQATEVIKFILGRSESSRGRLLHYNALDLEFANLKIERNSGCVLCGDKPSQKDLVDYDEFCGFKPNGVDEISADELRQRIKAKNAPIVVDVRENSEREAGFIEGSLHIPLAEFLNSGLPKHSLDSEVVIYCRSGNRSARAAEFLLSQGFKKVKNLKGGILSWQT